MTGRATATSTWPPSRNAGRPRRCGHWTALGLLSDVTIDDRPVQAVLGWEEREGVDFTVVEGRLPRAGDEVALGAGTAAERGVGVGEEVDLDGRRSNRGG